MSLKKRHLRKLAQIDDRCFFEWLLRQQPGIKLGKSDDVIPKQKQVSPVTSHYYENYVAVLILGIGNVIQLSGSHLLHNIQWNFWVDLCTILSQKFGPDPKLYFFHMCRNISFACLHWLASDLIRGWSPSRLYVSIKDIKRNFQKEKRT